VIAPHIHLDISYCISDMEHGIDQGVFTLNDFFNELRVWIDNKNPRQPALSDLRKNPQERSDDAKRDIAMELRHLRYFEAVADIRSFSQAARRLHLSQSAVSGQIADLERELGVVLLRRNRRAVSFTAEGRYSFVRPRRFSHTQTGQST
jgi:hypothetical protein